MRDPPKSADRSPNRNSAGVRSVLTAPLLLVRSPDELIRSFKNLETLLPKLGLDSSRRNLMMMLRLRT